MSFASPFLFFRRCQRLNSDSFDGCARGQSSRFDVLKAESSDESIEKKQAQAIDSNVFLPVFYFSQEENVAKPFERVDGRDRCVLNRCRDRVEFFEIIRR